MFGCGISSVRGSLLGVTWRRLLGGSRRSRLAGVIVLGTLALPVAVMGSAAPASAGATVQEVPGYALLGVACPTATTCEAVGGNNSQQEVVVPITNGIPGSAQPVSGTTELAGVACASATTCVAVGNNSPSNQAVVVPITNGAPGNAVAVPGALDLFGVACPTATTCLAVGRSPSDQGVVVPISNGTPGSAQAAPGTWGAAGALDSVSCLTATTCVAVGGSSSSGPGVVVPITSGTPGSAQAAPGTFTLTGVSCLTATCEAVGTSSPDISSAQGVVVPITNGTPGSAQPVPGTTQFNGVACPGVILCEAVGMFVSSSQSQGIVVPITNGTPGSAQAPGTGELLGVACPSAATCEAVGVGVVVTFAAAQTFVSLTFDNGAISQYTVGYQHALQPHAVKATFYINSGIMGGANHMSWSQLSTLAAAGQEIGGKTVDGVNLTTQSTAQQIAEICNERQALISHGLNPVGFAYPAGAFNTTIEAEVQNCGYGNGRTAGSLSPAGPTYAETLPPKNWLALRAYAPTGQVSLANLESLVIGAASHGGWVPVVIQKVCSQTLDPNNYTTCTSASGWIDLTDLNAFLSWVQNAGQAGGAPAGTGLSPIGATGTSADTTAPVTTIACNGAPCAATPYGATVSVTLSATDTGSGVSSTHYTTDGTTPTLSSPTYTGALTLTSSATVNYRSWDNAGNAEATHSQTIQI
jgi:peptidoglycan/xylan/chitin deacetylase (PgdA/CDA1 family)